MPVPVPPPSVHERIHAHILTAAMQLIQARVAHDAAKSDPTRNVATGQDVYAAERLFDGIARELMRDYPNEFAEVLREANLARLRLSVQWVASKAPKP